MIDENARAVVLEGFPLTMTVLVLVFLGLAVITVGIRTMVRVTDDTFGIDDWLIVAGLVSALSFTLCDLLLTDTIG